MSVARLGQVGKNVSADSSDTTSWNINSNSNSLVVTVIADSSATVSSIAYAGEALTLLSSKVSVLNPTTSLWLYYLANPVATFTNSLVTTFSGVCNARIFGVRFSGTDSTLPIENVLTGEVVGASPSLGVVTNSIGDIAWVVLANQPTAAFDEVVNFNGVAGTQLDGVILGTATLASSTFDTADVDPTAAFDLGDVGTVWTYIAYSVTASPPTPAPTVTGISPSTGDAAGGTPVTVTGTGFLAGASVAIGGVDCTAESVDSSTSITCTTGARAAATVNVVVTNTDLQAGTLTNGYTYSSGPTAAQILLLFNKPKLAQLLFGHRKLW